MISKRWKSFVQTIFIGFVLLSKAHATEMATPHLQKINGHYKSAVISKNQKQNISYGIGVDIGRNFRRLDLDLDLDQLTKGLKDASAGKKLDLSEDELRTIMSTYQNELKQKQIVAMKAIGETNQKEGEAFFADNAKKEGVISLPSGLQYKILVQGNGKKPSKEDTVECNYRGKLLNGIVFDSSYQTGKSALFKVDSVISGWQEALQLMPVGSKWQIFIPSQLAYSQRGAGRDIGPNATLIFEIELIGIQSSEAKTTTP